MVPVLLVGAWIGVSCGVATDRGRFALPSLSPALSSLAIIAFVLWRPNDPLALAWGTMAGALAQLAFQGIPALWATGLKGILAGPASMRDPAVREAGALLWPAILSSTMGQINVFIGTFFLSRAGEGSIAAWGYANIVYQLPLGTLLAALLVPLFPRLTSAAARDDRQALHAHLNRGVQLVAYVAIPLAALIALTAEPLVRVAFERGRFAATGGTGLTSPVLAILCAGMIGYALRDLFVRVFYALNDSKTPMRVMLVSVVLNIAANSLLMFGFGMGLQGIAWATVAVTWINFAQIAWSLRARLGTLGLAPSKATLSRAAAATAAAAAGVWALMRLAWPTGFWGAALELAVLGVAGSGLYGLALLFMHLDRIVKGLEPLPGRDKPEA
jgi:putative peptidoglycan lipid II flippase